MGFRGFGLEGELKHLMSEFRPGGIALFRRNIEGRDQIKDLVADAQKFAREELGRPILVAIDQEGGTVQRLTPYFTNLPSAQSMAAEGPEAIAGWARTAAADLVEIGVHINFAPVLDVVPKGDHFMHPRSLGSEPAKVAELGRVWIRTLQENGVSATAKHFPGLGRAALDPHHFTPVIFDDGAEAFRRDLIPFASAVEAGVHCVMTSHAVYPSIDPDLPATLSREINTHWLREKLGFGGILFSDDLDMAAIGGNFTPEQVLRRGLACGADFMLLCQKIDNIGQFYRTLAELLQQDEPLQRAHKQSVERIERLFRFHFPGGI